MKKEIFRGSAVALVTPFTDDGIDFDKLAELIEFQISKGTDAIVICGTTGESSTMTDDEHKEAIRFTVEKVNGRIPVIAGTGSNDTGYAIMLSQYAESVGADAVLLVTPYYNKTSQEGLYQHFKKIADSISISVVLYNVPTRTGININPETAKRLSEVDNIVAMKECNISQLAEVVNLCGPDFSIYSGNDDQVLPMMAIGAKGVISVAANIVPDVTHELATSFLNGDIEKSRSIQLGYLKLIKSLFIEVNPIPIKDAMNLMGMNVGQCRLPLVSMQEKNLNTLRDTLKEYNLI